MKVSERSGYRWTKPGLAHKGWLEGGEIDMRERGACDVSQYATCEMCGRKGIRYLREMTHANHPETLWVGRQCAEKMAKPYARDEAVLDEHRETA